MSLQNNLKKIFSGFEMKLRPLNRVEVSESAILHNFDFFKKKYDIEIWPVLKSNAYGHGTLQIAEILKKRKFTYFVCDSYFEALKIWEVNSHPVLLIGSMHPDNLQFLNFDYLTLMVQDFVTLKTLIDLDKSIKIHLKVNTGMNRQGFDEPEIFQVLKLLKNTKLILEGVFTHFADADNVHDEFTRVQMDNFRRIVDLIKNEGFSPKYFHGGATYGIPKSHVSPFNVGRLGIGLYGFGDLNLKPALRLISTITKVRNIKKGDMISYNLTFTAKHDMKIGVIPLGYNEGIDRRLSNRSPFLGRICMNLSVVDLSKKKVNMFDEFEVFSDKRIDENSVEKIAEKCQTILYDILVGINSTIRREIVG